MIQSRTGGQTETGDKLGKDQAYEFVKDLGHMLDVARLDADRNPQAALSNDLMVIEIGRKIMELSKTGGPEHRPT